jgi:hypothetical protein
MSAVRLRSLLKRSNESVFVVEIGANDGLSLGDVIPNLKYDLRTSNILLEPQPHVFKRLRENYNFSDFKVRQSAFSVLHGTTETYMPIFKTRADMYRCSPQLGGYKRMDSGKISISYHFPCCVICIS